MTVLQMQLLSLLNFSSDLLIASVFKVAATKWHHYVMDIPTDSAKIKSF